MDSVLGQPTISGHWVAGKHVADKLSATPLKKIYFHSSKSHQLQTASWLGLFSLPLLHAGAWLELLQVLNMLS